MSRIALFLCLIPRLVGQAAPPVTQEADDLATYAIPADAVKVERTDQNFHYFDFYPAGQPATPENRLGCESWFEGKRLLQRDLYQANLRHGIQREWNTGGQLISEEAYRHGVRHGVFRKWDDAGRLISHATLNNGSGTIRVYTLYGGVRSEETFKDNQLHGWSLTVSHDYVSPRVRSFSKYVAGKTQGNHYDFYLNGTPKGIVLWSPSGNDCCGVFFREDGTAAGRSWMLAGKTVSEAEYAQAVRTDPLLPAYYLEASRYLEAIPEEVRATERSRREMPAVKIPLTLDEHGAPGPMTAEDKRREILDYAVPAGARKVGPITMKGDHETAVNYLLERGDESTMVASEAYQRKALVARHLYLPTWHHYDSGLAHGVQREWHANGQLKSESPWWRGRMEGTFRHWDEQGQLIGQYEIHDGTGVRRIYSPDGRLEIEEPLVESMPHGLRMSLEKGHRSFLQFKRGELTGTTYGFHAGGVLAYLSFYHAELPDHLASPALHGPAVSFDPTGVVRQKSWYVHGREVEEAAYAEAAGADRTLPPYYADATRYQELVGKETRDLEARYRNAPKVRIPLQFDAHNNPLPRP